MNAGIIALPKNSILTCYNQIVQVVKIKEEDYGLLKKKIAKWAKTCLSYFDTPSGNNSTKRSIPSEILEAYNTTIKLMKTFFDEEEGKECLVSMYKGKIQAIAIFLENGTYLEYLVTHPKNLPNIQKGPRFKGAGSAIMAVWKKWLDVTSQTGTLFALNAAVKFYLSKKFKFYEPMDHELFDEKAKSIFQMCYSNEEGVDDGASCRYLDEE